MNFEQTPEFKKDLKRLQKKWRSLPSDIKAIQRDLTPLYVSQPGIDMSALRKAFFNSKRAAIIQITNTCEVVKMRLDVESIGRSDKVRVVFIAVRQENTVTFIEIYSKNDKDREDVARINRYMK